MTTPILLSLLILLSTALSYYETYFRTLSRVKIRRMFHDGEDPESQDKNATRIALLDIAIHFSVIIIHMAIVLLMYELLGSARVSPDMQLVTALALGIGVVSVCDLLLPGLLLKKDRKAFTMWEIGFLRLPYLILYPLTYPIRRALDRVSFSRQNQNSEKPIRSTDDVENLIDVGEEEGLFAEDEGELLHSVVEFSATVVREVMTPRTDIVSIQVNRELAELRSKFVESGHSRIPVYKDTIDEIVGIVHVKDLIRFWELKVHEAENLTIEKLMKPPYFIPETKRVDKLLREFQAEKIQIAVVVDEYGGVEGLVTVEDLVEVIVGEIKDEYDQEPEDLIVENEQSILVNGKIDIEEVEEYFDISFPEDDFETIGGFIFHQLGKVPTKGDEVAFNKLIFQVVDADERRIHSVRIILNNPEPMDKAEN